MKSIIYPIPKVFFIAYSGDMYAFGEVFPDQCMDTGLDTLETFEDELVYNARLLELGLQQQTGDIS